MGVLQMEKAINQLSKSDKLVNLTMEFDILTNI